MSVNRVSLVPHFALKNAGTKPHSAPAAILQTIMTGISAPFGNASRRQIMQAVVASAPASICPSPPRFQKRILNAGTTARDTLSSMAIFWRSTQVRRCEEKEAS